MKSLNRKILYGENILQCKMLYFETNRATNDKNKKLGNFKKEQRAINHPLYLPLWFSFSFRETPSMKVASSLNRFLHSSRCDWPRAMAAAC